MHNRMNRMRTETDQRVLLLADGDNVAIAKVDLESGTVVMVHGHRITLQVKILVGHKFAFKPVRNGETIVKYGAPIGVATRDIASGEYMHIHNIDSDYIPTYTLDSGHEFIKETH